MVIARPVLPALRRVRVAVETFAGVSAAVVEPQKSEYLKVKTFNGPHRAAFE